MSPDIGSPRGRLSESIVVNIDLKDFSPTFALLASRHASIAAPRLRY